jgi:hydrophobe/amphiphile efflux-1 (HAE1) family protein
VVDFFITRPIFASVVALLMILAGAVGYMLLPVAQFPEIAPPQVVVSSSYGGASAQTVAETVTTVLEQQINGVQGMSYMSSVSANDGTSTITVTFNVGYNVDIAAVDVQNRVSQASAQLPAIVNQSGITIQKKQPNFTLLVNLISADGSVDPITLSNYAYLQLVDPIKRLPGVSDVTIFGEKRYSMRVWLNPDRLARLGLTAGDVQLAILEQNLQVASGKLGQAPSPANQAFELQINTLGRLVDVKQFEEIVIRAGGGSTAAVHLRDLGRAELGALSYNSNAYLGDKPTVILAIYQLPGANALDLGKQVRAKMVELSPRFPPGISYVIKYDTTMFVAASLREVVITLAEAMGLVFIVVFVFLQGWRTTLIPAISIPVSLIGTLGVMEVAGFSINTVSLLGLVLAIGLVVDDAIVVVENVERQLEGGKKPLEAAKAAMKEVTGPIVATTAVLMAVFVPVAFLPGITGQLYRQFALYHRDLCWALRLQLAHAQPGALRNPAQATDRREALAVPQVQRRIRLARGPLLPIGPHHGPTVAGDVPAARGDDREHLPNVPCRAVVVRAGRGPRLLLHRDSASRWRGAGADRGGGEADSRACEGAPRSGRRGRDHRVQLPHRFAAVQQRRGVRDPETMVRAFRQGACGASYRCRTKAPAHGSPGCDCA